MVRNMSDSHIFLKKGVTVVRVARDRSHSRHGSQTKTHVGGGETGEVAGEIEPGWASPLVPEECCGSERASLGLP